MQLYFLFVSSFVSHAPMFGLFTITYITVTGFFCLFTITYITVPDFWFIYHCLHHCTRFLFIYHYLHKCTRFFVYLPLLISLCPIFGLFTITYITVPDYWFIYHYLHHGTRFLIHLPSLTSPYLILLFIYHYSHHCTFQYSKSFVVIKVKVTYVLRISRSCASSDHLSIYLSLYHPSALPKCRSHSSACRICTYCAWLSQSSTKFVDRISEGCQICHVTYSKVSECLRLASCNFWCLLQGRMGNSDKQTAFCNHGDSLLSTLFDTSKQFKR
jgi:hypothetical protein